MYEPPTNSLPTLIPWGGSAFGSVTSAGARRLAVSTEPPQLWQSLLLAPWERADGLNSFAAAFHQLASAAYKPGSSHV